MKYIYPLAIFAALLVVGGVAYLKYAPSASYSAPVENIAATDSTSSPQAASTTTNSYTLAQVAEHANASDCWTTINGSVYNITPFIPDHPGGDRILAVCGIDGTSLFEAQHSETPQAQAQLAKLKIGTLAQ